MKKLKEFKLPSVNNIKIGDIGFRFKKDFIGHGIFEGQVTEINNKVRRCIYSDGDIEDLTLEKLSYWNSRYLPSKKKIDYKDHKKDQVIDEIIDSDANMINENLSEVEFSNNCNDKVQSKSSVENKIKIEKDPKVSTILHIIDQHISFMSQNIRSLRSKTQRINLDAIIDIMIKKTNLCILYSRNMVRWRFCKRNQRLHHVSPWFEKTNK